jgi:hypothetical protein
MAVTPQLYGIRELYRPVDDSVEVEWVYDKLLVLKTVNM